LRRGDVVTVTAGVGYAGKPRPAVIIQSDDFSTTASVTICLVSADEIDALLFRLGIAPSASNGLKLHSWIMVDKIMTVRREKVGRRIGSLPAQEMVRLERALLVFLGLAGS
jgi:mRNA interferase MazF